MSSSSNPAGNAGVRLRSGKPVAANEEEFEKLDAKEREDLFDSIIDGSLDTMGREPKGMKKEYYALRKIILSGRNPPYLKEKSDKAMQGMSRETFKGSIY